MPATVGKWALRVPEDADNPDIPQDFLNLATDLSNVAMDDQGTLAARPVSTVGAPSLKPGRYWYVTGDGDASQNGRLWRDTGAGWVEVGMNRRPVLTALPGSPTDKDEILFQTAAMVTAEVGPWHLRYDSTLSGSKWAVVSASAWVARVATQESTGGNTTNYSNLTTVGPTVTAPASGEYLVANEATMSGTGTDQSFSVGATPADIADRIAGTGSLARSGIAKTIVSGEAVTAKVRSIGGSGTFENRMLALLPVRLR